MSRIDAIRRAQIARRARRPDAHQSEASAPAEPARLPVPVSPVERIRPRGVHQEGQAVFAAQMLGQDGVKRGLRAGQEAFDQANSLYNRTEWSGSKDRRARQGAQAKTQV